MSKRFELPPKHVWIDHTNVIQTDIDTLHGLLSDIDNWPKWIPGIASVRRMSKGFAKPGTYFLLVMEAPMIKRLVLPCVMYENHRNRMEWGGGFLGSNIRHSMALTAIDAHTTQLRHVEYATGFLCLGGKPAARFAHQHNLRCSQTVEARFATRQAQASEHSHT